MTRGRPFHRQLFRHLREVSQELPGGEAAERAAERAAQAVGRQVEQGLDLVTDRVGGPARLRVIVLLASVLAISSADTGAISAIAPKLETTLHIGNVEVGLLVTISALAAASGMLPAGWATDRRARVPLLTGAIVLWGVAEILSALAPSYLFLLLVRLALGALTAVTGPTLASLTGDLFPARERSQIYGYILTGELLGAGLGLLIAGLVTSWATWRVALAVLAVPSFVLSWQLRRRLPEPARGGQSRLERGAEHIVAAEEVEDAPPSAGPRGTASAAGDGSGAPAGEETPVLAEVRRRRVDARLGVILDRDPMTLGWWESFRYVVAVRSNVTLIVASALGYFFFGGVETFALIFIEGHFHVGQASATFITIAVGAAAVAGALAGGRVTDAQLRRGRIEARLFVPAAAFLVAAVVFVPAVISTTLLISVPLFLAAGFCIAAPNPGLDAARLDIMPARMWGRAEAVRSFLRSVLQAFAPLVFGFVSTFFGGRNAGFGANGGGVRANGTAHAAGLEPTFLVMLVTLVAAAFIAWEGRRYYAVDVAAAAATERRFPTVPGASSTSDTTPIREGPGTTARHSASRSEPPPRRAPT